MTRRLYLLRHGQTEFNASRRMQGQLDTHLSQVGREQARTAAGYFHGQGISKIISSDLMRAHDTALAVAEVCGLSVHTDERLRETNLGQWQGKAAHEVDQHAPGARAVWRHDPTWAPPEGETRLEVAARAKAVVDEQMRSFDGWDEGGLLLVAHGGTLIALTCALLNVPEGNYNMLTGLRNTRWAQLTAKPRFDPAAGVDAQPDQHFTAATIADPQWQLDGWNLGEGFLE